MTRSNRTSLLIAISAVAFSPMTLAHGEADWLHLAMDGALVFFTTLGFLLPVFLVSLLAEHRTSRFFSLQAATLGMGLMVGLWVLPAPADLVNPGLYARGYLIALGFLILFNLRLPAALVLVLLIATGALTGLEARHAIIGSPASGLALPFGFVLSAICFYLPATFIASRYPDGWQRTAIRVVASWVAAIASIDIAFMIAPPG